ncbi:MAG: DUF3336 domain-containing protein [Pseudomonadota bacterium]
MFNLSNILIADQFENVDTYDDWVAMAEAQDQRTGRFDWRHSPKSPLYNYDSIRHRLSKLKRLRREGDLRKLLFTLNEGIHGNMDGMGNAGLYRYAKSGTKVLIDDYVAEINRSLRFLAASKSRTLSRGTKLEFFDRASHCYGSTALMCSGAGALGYFHLGVVLALHDQSLLPRVISGSSAGSLIAAIVGTRTPKELVKTLDPTVLNELIRVQDDHVQPGRLRRMNTEEVIGQIERLVPDLTFEEAFELSGRQINITVSATRKHQKSRLLNAITSPNVLVRSAVQASCAVPGIYPPVTLLARDADGSIKKYLPKETWVDGSLAADLPARRLSRLYGVNHYIASQVNPVVLWSLLEYRHQDGIGPNLVDFGLRVQREWLRYLRRSSARLLSGAYNTSYWVDNVFSLLSQDYAGDINIVPRFRFFDPRKLLSHLSEKDRSFLIDEGLKATWPQIARIRNSSSIALTLQDIIEKMTDGRRTSASHTRIRASA